ncbi:MAG: PDZ domain-containing protein [Mediterranea sp.]|jgi:C-terminal processing protease CtpA/Prc|nr:PDZ domain-containing protein [Mediterranea sp.]
MKYITYLFFCCLFLNACKNDDDNNGKADDDRTEYQTWIEDKMRAEYLWNITSTPDYSKTGPEDFFISLLSDEDGKTRNNQHYYYSYIEDASAQSRGVLQEDYSYGFEFTGIYRDGTYTTMQALVLYVVEGSPAAQAGLRRGDWITEINGAPLTDSNYLSLLGAEACAFTIMRWDSKKGAPVTLADKIEIVSARRIEDHPVFMAKVLNSPQKDKKVGYLLYNHFTDGKGDKDISYDDRLRSVSEEFQQAGVEEFVLDLRYNNGGLLSSALVLSAILAPESTFEKDFAYMQYRDQSKYTYRLDRQAHLKSNGKNLNLKTLYVLVSSTSASASEMVINSLRPYMGQGNVILIGERTEGKNVASVSYTSSDERWIMHPIIGRILNSKGESDYVDGFAPDHELDEVFIPVGTNTVRVIEVLPLGDPNERLLFAALSLIDGTAVASGNSRSSDGTAYRKAAVNSLDRRATNGVVVDL